MYNLNKMWGRVRAPYGEISVSLYSNIFPLFAWRSDDEIH